ncbi:aldehyde-activating protein [Lysobacteraceae bacterium NML120232]|nr:aldehyde-activating protein [Xanthomonadaceae bacterium NML120232]
MPMLEGGCLCGALRYQVQPPWLDAGFCHCRLCQRASGAPVVAWGSIDASRFAYTRGKPARFASSPAAVREFCPHCGTALTFRTTRQPGLVDFTLASLDHPEQITPQYHIWTSRQQPWLLLGDALPRHVHDEDSPAQAPS